ncbi:MAG: hypothetical protein KatS3mg083_439 [Candidatus Dojkabacteria bacterium]|nr:MAG: hypothetical protein KatS3mg083_439 [Candidatus Dojkabacteria bacterium]
MSNEYTSNNQPKQIVDESGKTGSRISLLEKVRSNPAFVYAALIVVLVIALVAAALVYNTELWKKSSLTDNTFAVSSENDKKNVPYNVPAQEIRFKKTKNIYERSNEYRLGEELVVSYPIGGLKSVKFENCSSVIKMPAEPVISADGTKLYFVEESNPREVKVMDLNKNVSVVYVAPDKYPFVASIAVGPDGSTSYTLFDRNLAVKDCVPDFEKVLALVKSVHIVNGKELPDRKDDIKDKDVPSYATNEIRYVFNDEYFALELNTNGISFAVLDSIIIRRVSDNSLVGKFLNLIHEDKLSGEVYVTRKIQCGVYECEQLYKFNIRTGTLDFIFGGDGAYIKDITVTNDSIVIKYSDKFDQKTQRPIFDDLKTFEYKFSRN